MKKITSILLILVFTIGTLLTGCGNSKATNSDENKGKKLKL